VQTCALPICRQGLGDNSRVGGDARRCSQHAIYIKKYVAVRLVANTNQMMPGRLTCRDVKRRYTAYRLITLPVCAADEEAEGIGWSESTRKIDGILIGARPDAGGKTAVNALGYNRVGRCLTRTKNPGID